MSVTCAQIKKEYEQLIALKDEFVLECEKVNESDDLTHIKELKAKLEKARDE